jgi:HTH-type transcriptional regulator, sugar sensing transcriptional regulator
MDLKEKLQSLGVTKREAEIYLALLQKKEFSAGEISKITSISRNKSYEILQNLVKKGLCNESYKNGIKVFSCIKPKIVMKNMLTDLEKKKELVYELNKSLTDIYEKNGTNESPIDYIEVLTDKGQIQERFMMIQQNTKKELLGFTKPPYSGVIGDNIDSVTNTISKSVKVLSIYEYKDLTPEETDNLIKIIEMYQKLGEESKIIRELPMKLLISDETISMFALNNRISLKPSITSIVVDHPTFAKAQKEVFESYWQRAMVIEDFKSSNNILYHI